MSYITIQEAGERIGVSPQTIRNYLKWKILKGYELYRNPESRRPGRILIKEEDLENKFLGKIVYEDSEVEDEDYEEFHQP